MILRHVFWGTLVHGFKRKEKDATREIVRYGAVRAFQRVFSVLGLGLGADRTLFFLSPGEEARDPSTRGEKAFPSTRGLASRRLVLSLMLMTPPMQGGGASNKEPEPLRGP